ncbi:MAG TPA: bacterial transcriptional activator domain-containing protein, partial [Herpetosiphonaceae bacterium]
EVTAREWQRKKAAQLFALLLANRHRWLLREQICEHLWPEESPSEAESHFKVTLNAVNVALEPARPPRTPPFYIRRQGSAYRFIALDGVWLDVDEFESRIANAKLQLAAGDDDAHLAAAQMTLSAAVDLYRGDYLSDWLYEEWAQNERERLATVYLEALTTLAELLISRDQPAEAIPWCEMILMRDPCWEAAYVLLMQAYARQGNRRQALATYERCVRNLRAQMDIAPLPQTTQVYEEVKSWSAPFPQAQARRLG